MTEIEELKRRQYDTWNRYYQKHKSEINARRKKVREDYKNKLLVAENQLTKAKEIIKELMSFSVQLCDCRHTVDFEKTRVEAKQFLSEVEK